MNRYKYFSIILLSTFIFSDELSDTVDVNSLFVPPENFAEHVGINFDLYVQKSDFSNEEIGYHPCNFKKRSSYKGASDSFFFETQDAMAENIDELKAYLMSKSCYFDGRVNKLHQYKEMDFDSLSASFIDTYKGSPPICTKGKLKHLCFGSGSYHSGIFIGEWENSLPNGKGVALITANFPGFGSPPGQNAEALYKGTFKNGYPHGHGFYTDGKFTFDGGWHSGEMHGDIGWIYPASVVYGFGYQFDYELELLKVTNIVEGSEAQKAGIKNGDSILAYQLDEDNQIKEIQSIPLDIFIDELNQSSKISLHINVIGNTFNLQKSEIYTFYGSYNECLANIHKKHGCNEKAKLNNTYTGKNNSVNYARGSYKMGLRHTYNQWDQHRGFYSDGSSGLIGTICNGAGTPFLGGAYNTTSSENAVKHDGSSNVWVQSNFNITPCITSDYAAMVYPELILENEQLLEESWSEIKKTNTKIRKIDFIYLLKDAVEQKDSLVLWDERKYNFAKYQRGWGDDKVHFLCKLSLTINNYACLNLHPSGALIDKLRTQIAMNPMTKANKTKNQQQLAHAKFKYALIKSCKELMCNKRMHTVLIDQGYWRCKYFGYPDTTCAKKVASTNNFKHYTAVFDYIENNPKEFVNVDFSEWLLGKELEF